MECKWVHIKIGKAYYFLALKWEQKSQGLASFLLNP